VAGRAGGPILFQAINFTLLVASLGSGVGAQLSARVCSMAWGATA